MNLGRTLGIGTISAIAILTTVTFAVPQQKVLAWGHHNHYNNNGIKVDQQINQLNSCSSPLHVSVPPVTREWVAIGPPFTDCQNSGSNNADIQR